MAAKQLTLKLVGDTEPTRDLSPEEIKRERNRASGRRSKARRRAKKLGLEGPPLLKRPNGSVTPSEAKARAAEYGREWRARQRAANPPKPPKPKLTEEEKAARAKARRDAKSDEQKAAMAAYRAEWHQKNKQRKKEMRRERLRRNREENNAAHQTRLAQARETYYRTKQKLQADPALAAEVRTKVRSYANDYRRKPKYRAYANAAERQRMKTDLQFRFMRNLRDRVRVAIKASAKKSGSSSRPRGQTTKMLGCTIPELMAHIESLFLPGMTWDNWNYRGWHLDHIKPLSSFNLLDPDERAKALHFTNLQPLWAEENFQKSGKTDWKPPLKKAA